jgi:hypothetical protein
MGRQKFDARDGLFLRKGAIEKKDSQAVKAELLYCNDENSRERRDTSSLGDDPV